MAKTKDVQIEDKVYTIKKLALGKYADMLAALKDTPLLQRAMEIQATTEKELVAMIPALLADGSEELFKVISIATDIEMKELRDDSDIGLDGLATLISAILEVNDFNSIKKNFSVMLKAVGLEEMFNKKVEEKTKQLTNGSQK